MANNLTRLEDKLTFLIQETQKRKKAAKKSKIEHYFAGQHDAFNQVLLELKIVKYEHDMLEDADETLVVEEAPVAEEPSAVDADSPGNDEPAEETTKTPPPRKKRAYRKKAKAEKPSPEMIAAQELLKQAVQSGVIDQKISLYKHEDFPDGKLRGRAPVLELLLNDAMAEKISAQIAEKQAA